MIIIEKNMQAISKMVWHKYHGLQTISVYCPGLINSRKEKLAGLKVKEQKSRETKEQLKCGKARRFFYTCKYIDQLRMSA